MSFRPLFRARVFRAAAIATALGCGLGVSACAVTADQIAPAGSDAPFEVVPTCDALMRRRAQLAERLIFASIEQNQVAREDRERLFGVAPSMFGTLFRGDRSSRVAILKREVVETDMQLAGHSCIDASR